MEVIDLFFKNLLYFIVYYNIVALIAKLFVAQTSHFQRVLGVLNVDLLDLCFNNLLYLNVCNKIVPHLAEFIITETSHF